MMKTTRMASETRTVSLTWCGKSKLPNTLLDLKPAGVIMAPTTPSKHLRRNDRSDEAIRGV